MDFYIARQPIYDRNGEIYAYELLYREEAQTTYDHSDGDYATAGVIRFAFMFDDIKAITQGKKAFINFTQKLIENDVATLFPSEHLVVEILEDVTVNERVIENCQKLKALGYTIALDDYCYQPNYDKLLELADIIKIDFRTFPKEKMRDLLYDYKDFGKTFVAEKIESDDEYNLAQDLGFDYFQGFYLSKPTTVNKSGIEPIKSNYIRLMDAVLGSQPDYNQIAKIIESDVAFSYEILRIVNTLKYYRGRRINSVKQGLILMGLYRIKKWIYITILCKKFAGKNNEILIQSLIRAKFMEALANLCYRETLSCECFTIGIFSLIDVLMERPMEELLEQLPLNDHIKDIILGKETIRDASTKAMQNLFWLVLDYEKGLWDKVDRYAQKLRVSRSDIKNIYVDSVIWAYRIFDMS